MKKRALLSVFYKEGVADLASRLAESGWEILSTGGTATYLRDAAIPVTDISALTGFPECLDGRVKTLHPAVHAGILARREEKSHLDTLEQLKLGTIDLVCVNLYPFFEKARTDLSREEIIEFIDIGGPAMLRSAAKNYRDVIVLTDPADYPPVIESLPAGTVPPALRKRLAGKVFALTSAYDAAVARFLLDEDYPDYWPCSLSKAQNLRYGENSHQTAALYLNTGKPGVLGSIEQLHGKELSYNNIRDLDLAWKAVCAFGLASDDLLPLGTAELEAFGLPEPSAEGRVCCAAVKHNTPCGIALGSSLPEAYAKTYACDPVSIFGGIVACNVKIDPLTAEKLSELFLEIVAAPDFDTEALEILKKKKNLRIIRAPRGPREERECISVDGGLLAQQTDRKLLEKWEVVTQAAPDPGLLANLIFGMRVVSCVKSNAIVAVTDLAAAGIGGGETNRIWAAERALERARKTVTAGGVLSNPARALASDAFFPFPDVAEAAAAAGIEAIIQPGGSVNDKRSVEACDRRGIAMVFTGARHFKH
ncbi:MAG: bifunctional phosphoribosylaminoimidazolecarboxamide formyltransferase/IMP cyclohydrolase [Treponema sp.]|jgi:phosphoribosylaminoimidazolecarboxamide formyltransferase/IMP cyclohydrolase|nr:bifunctional phosphoribosylaminoimidazolecarboxamide formyltransferase/IMP cyclohydrolase [Treponema sp.]